MSLEVEVIGKCTVYCADAREVLSALGQVHAVITDPPYGHGWEGIDSASPGGRRWTKRRTCQLSGYSTPFDPRPWLALGHQHVFWGANHYAPQLPASGGWLVWDKREGTTANHLSDCEMAWADIAQGARLFRYLWNGLCRAGEIGEHLHPNQKPIALMRWCIEKTTGVVCDPFAGSFTTGVACIELQRPFIGVEIEREYFDSGCQRLEKAYRQPQLFPVSAQPMAAYQEVLL